MHALRDLLKSHTQSHHQSLESRVRIFERCRDSESYALLLFSYLCFYEKFEEKLLAKHSGWMEASRQRNKSSKSYQYTPKLSLLQKDIATLKNWGLSSEVLQKFKEMEKLSGSHLQLAGLSPSFHHAVGSLYVIEGSQLGGSIISKRLKNMIKEGLLTKVSSHFFEGEGKKVWETWAKFLQLLESIQPSPEERDQVLESASQTFLAFEGWIKVCDELLVSAHVPPSFRLPSHEALG